MIVSRLTWFLNRNKLLNPSQARFRKLFSTSDPIIRLNQEAEFATKTGNTTMAITIDFSRTFDLLWIDVLLIKLMNLNITGVMLHWIKNFLTNRTSRVLVGNSLSFDYSSENGTP